MFVEKVCLFIYLQYIYNNQRIPSLAVGDTPAFNMTPTNLGAALLLCVSS